MNKYDSEYFIAFSVAGEDENVSLKPDRKTTQSGMRKRVIPPGRPLYFTNAAPEYIPEGKTERITDVMFDDPDLVVNEKIKNYAAEFDISNLQLYPAVYIDLNNKYHENLWYLNFYTSLDCWDREHSSYDTDDDDDIVSNPSITTFSLNEKLLDDIPEENRLMFAMGGLDQRYIFMHRKIADFLTDISATGIRLIPVIEYEDGMEQFPV